MLFSQSEQTDKQTNKQTNKHETQGLNENTSKF